MVIFSQRFLLQDSLMFLPCRRKTKLAIFGFSLLHVSVPLLTDDTCTNPTTNYSSVICPLSTTAPGWSPGLGVPCHPRMLVSGITFLKTAKVSSAVFFQLNFFAWSRPTVFNRSLSGRSFKSFSILPAKSSGLFGSK